MVGIVRALRKDVTSYVATINAVAPGPTNTKIMPVDLVAAMNDAGIPMNDPHSVGLSIVYAATAMENGRRLNGKAIWVDRDKWMELEEPLAAFVKQWSIELEV